MAPGPNTSSQVDGEIVEIARQFILRGLQNPENCECSHEIKSLLLGGKVMTNLDSISESRDITLPTKVCLIKAIAFPVVMY